MRDSGQQKAPPAQLCAAQRCWRSRLHFQASSRISQGIYRPARSDFQNSHQIMRCLAFSGLRSLDFHVHWGPGWGCSIPCWSEPFSHFSSSQQIGFQLRTSTFTTSSLHQTVSRNFYGILAFPIWNSSFFFVEFQLKIFIICCILPILCVSAVCLLFVSTETLK